jgi:restriction system protein
MRDLWTSLQAFNTVPPEAVPYVLFTVCVAATVAALLGYARRRAKRRRLWARQRSLDTLRAMTWQEFEQLTGETFRRLGFAVRETGGGGVDGGLDLLLSAKGKTWAVQCKHYKRHRVGAPIVREAVGVAVDVRAAGVYVVALGGFTRAAEAYAKGKPVHLVDGLRLLTLIEQGKARKT